jgi:hypothetical protein
VAAQQSITLIDAATGLPVEGALVLAPGELRVFRSDVRGVVELPAGYGRAGVRVHSQHHTPVTLPPGAADGPVLLHFDAARSNPLERARTFSRADTLRGAWGPWRANNDLLSYDLDVTVRPADAFIHGTNVIRFRMLEDGRRIQLDLFENMDIDSIVHAHRPACVGAGA